MDGHFITVVRNTGLNVAEQGGVGEMWVSAQGVISYWSPVSLLLRAT